MREALEETEKQFEYMYKCFKTYTAATMNKKIFLIRYSDVLTCFAACARKSCLTVAVVCSSGDVTVLAKPAILAPDDIQSCDQPLISFVVSACVQY